MCVLFYKKCFLSDFLKIPLSWLRIPLKQDYLIVIKLQL